MFLFLLAPDVSFLFILGIKGYYNSSKFHPHRNLDTPKRELEREIMEHIFQKYVWFCLQSRHPCELSLGWGPRRSTGLSLLRTIRVRRNRMLALQSWSIHFTASGPCKKYSDKHLWGGGRWAKGSRSSSAIWWVRSQPGLYETLPHYIICSLWGLAQG